MSDYNPTEEQRANLLELADLLESGVEGKNGYSFEFDMGCYFRDIDSDGWGEEIIATRMKNLHGQCNSSACAIGVAVLGGIGRSGTKYIQMYAQDVFGTDEENTPEGEWMFSSYWEETDNTPHGAAARIRWLLEKGLPDNWEEQMFGEQPLCYK